jgi:hypothetical protein
MELRVLVVVAPEHEEELGGRGPALVRRSLRRSRFGSPLGRPERDGLHDHFCWRNESCRTWQRRKRGVVDPGGAKSADWRRVLVGHLIGHQASACARAQLDTEENETWPLKIKAIPKVKGVRAKGGWFYQVAYTQKDRIYDHCRTFHTGVDAAGATM